MPFDDVRAGNDKHVATFATSHLSGQARQGLAIVTCMDSRISPLDVVGMGRGDAKILRNAGARVTEDVLRTLILATYLLGVNRILVMPHTDCRMAEQDESAIHDEIKAKFGVDTRSLEFRTTDHQREELIKDINRIRAYPLLPPDVEVVGGIYDVKSGKLELITE